MPSAKVLSYGVEIEPAIIKVRDLELNGLKMTLDGSLMYVTGEATRQELEELLEGKPVSKMRIESFGHGSEQTIAKAGEALGLLFSL